MSTVIHEVQQVMWVETPHGNGQVLFIMDYGPHENSVWVVALKTTREIKHYTTKQIKICMNHTFYNQ